jgi:hypothetical protein
MSDQSAWGMCAAFGCPLLGSVGGDGKWYCFCHAGRPSQVNDSITHCLRNDEAAVVELTLAIRRDSVRDGQPELTAQAQRALQRHPDAAELRFDRHRDIGARAWLQRLERYLIGATSEFGKQQGLSGLVPTAPVIGPTHALTHYTEHGE